MKICCMEVANLQSTYSNAKPCKSPREFNLAKEIELKVSRKNEIFFQEGNRARRVHQQGEHVLTAVCGRVNSPVSASGSPQVS